MEHKYWENPKDVTDDLRYVINAEKAFMQPGQVSANISIEECIPGFLFNIISTQEDLTIAMHIEHNKLVNPNIEMDAHEITKILARWPGVHMDMFRRGPTAEYTALMVYFNQSILHEKFSNYPEEGLHVIDIIPHDTGIPLSRKHKEKFVKTIGLKTMPLQYNGMMLSGFEKIGHFASTSKINRSGVGYMSRLTFEPRMNMDTFIVRATKINQDNLSTDTPTSLANELGKFIVTPQRIIEIDKTSKWNPKTRYNKFTQDLIKQVMEDTGYFGNYYARAVAVDESLTEDVFKAMVTVVATECVRQFTDEMKDYRFK